MLETIAAETYQAETSMLKSKAAIGLSASIEPVEMQHIAILYYVMGMYPGSADHCGAPHRVQLHRRGSVSRCESGEVRSGRPGVMAGALLLAAAAVERRP